MKCSRCGAEGEGNYCASCGAPLGTDQAGYCPSCGAEADGEALFCTECGEPLRERPSKSFQDYLPWVLSGLALVAFAIGIALFVQDQAGPRAPGAPPTGGLPTPDESSVSGGGADGAASGGAATGGAAEGGMPSAGEIANMPPREAANRLFNRAMRLASGEDPENRAPFFAQMGVRAYQRVPDSQMDADLRFHVGLLQLVQGNVEEARSEADAILSEHPAHLLALLLKARAAEADDDSGAAATLRDSLRAAAGRVGLDARPEYRAHQALLEQVLDLGG
jgi:hypothetical protein